MARQDTEALLRCDGLGIAYADERSRLTTVVDGVSLSLRAGEALGIVGESGSGKSTLARAMLGFLRSGARFVGGSVRLEGVELVGADAATLASLRGRRVAMVPQNPLSSLTYHLPVGAQVIEVLRTRAGLGRTAARMRMLELFERTGLPDPVVIARRYPHQLSGGQRQRVVIASALACRPALLVMDEPTTALDKTTEAQVLELVASLRRDGDTALVLVTHDLNVVARVCERVLVMKSGRIVEQGDTDRVFSSPQTLYGRELLGAVLRIDSAHAPPLPVTGDSLLQLERLVFSWQGRSWLWRRRAGARVLDDISLSVRRGEVLGVIGESGSGKTTLGMAVAGLLQPQEGRILLDGEALARRVERRTHEQRRRVQMVFQDPLSSLNPRHTVGRTLMRPLRLFQGLDGTVARQRAVALLAALGLDAELLARYPRQLSGGQQQRVAVARAFAAAPQLLICDEITSALDATVQAQLLAQLIAMQRRDGVAVLLITHDLSVIWKMAPRVVVIQRGRIVETGVTDDVLLRPAHPYTASLVDAATRAGRMLEARQGGLCNTAREREIEARRDAGNADGSAHAVG